MARLLSPSSSWRRAAICCVAWLGLFFADLHAPLGSLGGVSVAHADDDDDDDDDDGGGGFSGSRSRGGGGGGAIGKGSAPKVFRFLQREFLQARPPRRNAQRRAAPAPQLYQRDEIIAFGLDSAQVDTLVSRGFAVHDRRPLGSLGGEVIKLDPPSGQTLEAARDSVRDIAPLASVDLNHFYEPNSADASCGGQPCVAPDLVGWPIGDARGRCAGEGITIGLIDTAINAGHDTFRSSRLDVLRLDPSAADQSGKQHGTAVASLLVGTGDKGTPGLLPQARLVAVDAFRANDRTDAYDLVRAIDMLLGRDVGVINMSLSGPDNALLAKAVSAVSARGIEMVAAAGNEGPGAVAAFPAAYDPVIAVTAVDRRKRVYRRANRGDYIDLAAPGVGVWAAASLKGTRQKTGTSFAAPFVAAAAALAKSQPGRNQAVGKLLASQAEDLGDPGKDQVFGWGLLNVRDLCR